MVTLGIRFLKASLIYYTITVIIGIIFSIRPIHDIIMLSNYMAEFHSHMSLIGWVSMALLGLMYLYLENKEIIYNENLGSRGFMFLAIGSILMPIMLLITGIVNIISFSHLSNYSISDRTPMIELVVISAIIICIGSFMSAYNIYKALDK